MEEPSTQALVGSLIELLPTELKLSILLATDDARSAIDLLLTGPAFYSIVKGSPESQASIARKMAAGILNDTNPDGIKLAFMAAEARLIDNRSLECVEGFMDTYAHHNPWPARLYRLRAVLRMPDMHAAASEMLDWVYRNKMVWPVRPTDRTFSPTEIARQHHACYALDAGFTLLQLIPGAWSLRSYIGESDGDEDMRNPMDPILKEGHLTVQPFKRVSHRFWAIFSAEELERMIILVCLLQMIHSEIPYEGAQVEHLFLCRRELEHLYGRLSFAYIHGEGWYEYSRGKDIWTTIMISASSCKTITPHRTINTPFVDDPTAFISLDRVGRLQGWLMNGAERYFKPCVLQVDDTLRHTWLFLIGDQERCNTLLSQGPVWEIPAPCTHFMELVWEHFDTVDWLVDPALFGVDRIVKSAWRPIYLRRYPHEYQADGE